MNYDELKIYCKKIQNIVGKEAISSQMCNEVISNYYSKTTFYYKNFHSKEGAMHMPISFSNETSHDKKLLYQADFIHEIINKYSYNNILELGCGTGFNTNYLSAKNPDKNFTGVDLTARSIKTAIRNSRGAANVKFYQLDFDVPWKENSEKQYDLIFGIETLCHSKNLIELINNLKNILSDVGRIIIFDGYVKQNATVPNKKYEKAAYQLLLWGFALHEFQKLEDVLTAKKLDFLYLENSKEYTTNVLSNYLALQKGAKRLLRFPLLLKILLKIRIIPIDLIKHLSAGVFGPYFINSGYLGYYKLELKKKSSSGIETLD